MIAVISEDLRNGGILGVAQGIHEAATEIHWTVKVFDAGGSPSGRDRATSEALASQPDGVILVGADAEEMQSRLSPFTAQRVPIVGWHVGPKIGVLTEGPVRVNVSTDPLEVACVTAAAAAVAAKQPRGGVVIFTDPNFKIAQTKSDAMADIIRSSTNCTLLEVREVAISKTAQQMPGIVRELLDRYGNRWTCGLAINDIYFDYAIPELTKAGKPADSIRLLSAGDGSAAAIMRIQAGIFQTGTVAEPLNLHGWQLVDELNRLMAHQPPSGYIAPVHLVTAENVAFDAGPRLHYDPDNGYRAIYRHIWKR
jgi:ribose transport system substrate-binding protein